MDFDDLYNLDFRWWLLIKLGCQKFYLMKLDIQNILDITPPGMFAWYEECTTELQLEFLKELNYWNEHVSQNE